MNTTTPSIRSPSMLSAQLPSIDEEFRSAPPLFSIKRDFSQGTFYPAGAAKSKPPPGHLSLRQEVLAYPHSNSPFTSSRNYESESDLLAPQSSQGAQSSLPRLDHNTGRLPPLPPRDIQPRTQTYPYPHFTTTPHQFNSSTSSFFSDKAFGNKEPAPDLLEREKKRVRLCDEEIARRHHAATYTDLGFSLREMFRWAEDSFSSDAPVNPVETNSASKSKEERPQPKKDISRKTKLREHVIWEFRACMYIDKGRAREWLDRLQVQVQEHKRKKQTLEVMRESRKSEKEREKERKKVLVESAKSKAVMEIFDLVESEFRKHREYL